jgi:hypothetical protein
MPEHLTLGLKLGSPDIFVDARIGWTTAILTRAMV